MTTNTPVLLLIFNRPQLTGKVLDRIRMVKPAHLYVCADGPRPHVTEDIENCRLARQVIETVDWDCTVKTLFRDVNIGCRRAVQSGIDWFFEHEEAGIILEDDCLPHPTFFDFCEVMLKKYASDDHVMHISGHNPAADACLRVDASYLYSKFSFVWGWATWRRAWKHYDDTFPNLDSRWGKSGNAVAKLVDDKTACRYLFDKFQRTRDGELNTWDYAWFYNIITHKGWCINAASNLVENIGFDRNATHTGNFYFNFRSSAKANAMTFPLRHPDQINCDRRIESSFFQASQKGYWGLLLRRILPGLFFRPLPKTTIVRRPKVWHPQPIWFLYPRTPAQDWV